jgi:hypothetical protein
MGAGVVHTKPAVQFEGLEHGLSKVFAHHPRFALLDDIDGTGDGVSRHRNAGGHRLQYYETEGVGAAGEYKYVRVRDDRGQFLAPFEAEKMGLGITPAHFIEVWPVADHELAAWQIER